MASVLVIAGHVNIESLTSEGLRSIRGLDELRRGTGSRGEREWTGHVAPLLGDRLRARGIEVVVHDASYAPTVYGRDYDLLINLHYMRDSPDSRAFGGIPAEVSIDETTPYISQEARRRAQMWIDRFHNEYPVVTTIPSTPQKVGPNIVHNYLWDFPSKDTPCVLIEAGHADLDAAVLFEPNVARVVSALDVIIYEYLTADLGLTLGMVPAPAPQPVIPADPYPLASFPVSGVWDGDARALEAAVVTYAEGRAPAGIGLLYAQHAGRFKIRADVAVAQAAHETGRWRFEGTDPIYSAKPEWFNWSGLKTTNGEATARFQTVEKGVFAHLAHLAWYAHTEHVNADCSASTDPRHFTWGHKGEVRVIDDLGKRWAPSPDYGKGVARHLAEVRGRVASWTPVPAQRPLAAIAADLAAIAEELQARA